jgi:hypothetical protein
MKRGGRRGRRRPGAADPAAAADVEDAVGREAVDPGVLVAVVDRVPVCGEPTENGALVLEHRQPAFELGEGLPRPSIYQTFGR